jgi:hypothetical protein
MDRALHAQFHPLEEALSAMGVVVWPMVELEADDALASAARLAAADPRVEKVCIWTPDKDLAQCVDDGRVVQVDRRSGAIRDASGVREKFGVDPERIPDYLALVGDSSDGYRASGHRAEGGAAADRTSRTDRIVPRRRAGDSTRGCAALQAPGDAACGRATVRGRGVVALARRRTRFRRLGRSHRRPATGAPRACPGRPP